MFHKQGMLVASIEQHKSSQELQRLVNEAGIGLLDIFKLFPQLVRLQNQHGKWVAFPVQHYASKSAATDVTASITKPAAASMTMNEADIKWSGPPPAVGHEPVLCWENIVRDGRILLRLTYANHCIYRLTLSSSDFTYIHTTQRGASPLQRHSHGACATAYCGKDGAVVHLLRSAASYAKDTVKPCIERAGRRLLITEEDLPLQLNDKLVVGKHRVKLVSVGADILELRNLKRATEALLIPPKESETPAKELEKLDSLMASLLQAYDLTQGLCQSESLLFLMHP